ncbi:hypothetical protein [Paenibacillus sp. FSL H8-0332]|uniref:hypothetical protein n=1 Tax=Paenibacillus sp. FSL H8-0332 TaxID=2954742 RepID=UPI0030D1BE94
MLWQRSVEPFWNDGHISKQMLEAHLNPDWEAASRRHSDIDCSVKWLSRLIPLGAVFLTLAVDRDFIPNASLNSGMM